MTTRGPVVKGSSPYILPPARGMRQRRTPQALHSFDVNDAGANSPPRGRVPHVDFPKFDARTPDYGKFVVRIILRCMKLLHISG
jgi:hypothetical protein